MASQTPNLSGQPAPMITPFDFLFPSFFFGNMGANATPAPVMSPNAVAVQATKIQAVTPGGPPVLKPVTAADAALNAKCNCPTQQALAALQSNQMPLSGANMATSGQTGAPNVSVVSGKSMNASGSNALGQLFGQGSANALSGAMNQPGTTGGIFGNPLAQVSAQGLKGLTGQPMQVVGNASAIPKSYLQWKKNVDMDDYLSARKYLTWKNYCGDRSLDDWMKYGEWKPTWNAIRSQVPPQEFSAWANVASAEDANLYKEWRAWQSKKQNFKSKYQPTRQRNMKRCENLYKRFVRRCNLSDFAKYKKFLDWDAARSVEGKDIFDVDAYSKWNSNYIAPSKKDLQQMWTDWKSAPTRADMAKFVEYVQFRKVKQAYDDDTEASFEDRPNKFYKDRNFLRRHRRYWKAWYDKFNDEDNSSVDTDDSDNVKNYNEGSGYYNRSRGNRSY
jgi:hypothetical protein